ncbi:MAG: hypothetical protein AAFX93_15770 [Verrucomicrobiota bacterium]
MRILVLDDRREFAQFVALKLKRNFGLEAETCYTVETALESLKRDSYDVVISDLQIGFDDAYGLMAGVKYMAAEGYFKVLPRFAALTSHGDQADHLLEAGFEVVWGKDHSHEESFIASLDGFLFQSVVD